MRGGRLDAVPPDAHPVLVNIAGPDLTVQDVPTNVEYDAVLGAGGRP